MGPDELADELTAPIKRTITRVNSAEPNPKWNRTVGSGLIGVVEPEIAENAALREAGRRDDFDALYREHALWASRLGFLLTGDPGVAEELVQETFLGFYRHAERVENPQAYLRATLANLACRRRRREQRRSAAHRLVARRESVSASANDLFDVVIKLPARQRAVIVLRYYEGLSEAEIAVVLGCAPGTVKSLASRAIDRLRKDLR